jgi:hypothetical protein
VAKDISFVAPISLSFFGADRRSRWLGFSRLGGGYGLSITIAHQLDIMGLNFELEKYLQRK